MKKISREEEYRYRYENRSEKELELAKIHNCDGLCYGDRFMCPYVEMCPKTRGKECIATFATTLAYMLLYLIIFIVPIIFIISFCIK